MAINLNQAADQYLAAGLCVLPARRVEKRPAAGRWRQYQQRLPTESEVSAWFANPRSHPDALCILCGKVSGNGEMIDFDAGGEKYDAWAQRIPPDLLAKLVIESTQRDGPSPDTVPQLTRHRICQARRPQTAAGLQSPCC